MSKFQITIFFSEVMVLYHFQRPGVEVGPDLERREDVEQRERAHGVRVVQGEAVRSASAPVVAHDVEELVPEPGHHRHLVGGHGGEGSI